MQDKSMFARLERIDHAVIEIKAKRLRGDALTESDKALVMLYNIFLSGAWKLECTAAMQYQTNFAASAHTHYALQYMLGTREPVAGTDWVQPRHSLVDYALFNK